MSSKAILMLFLAVLGASAMARDAVVRGYVRQDGTYVQPHVKTAPNNTIQDNYSTKGNYNPYTGQAGTVDPYKAPQPAQLYSPPVMPQQKTCGNYNGAIVCY